MSGPHDKVRNEFLPFSRPTIEEDEIAEVVDSLRTGWITTGPKVQRLEEMFRERFGMEHAVAVNSATAGLHLAVEALDLKPGDEVIVPSITWASTANVVELCGGRAVFADVDPGTLCISPAHAKSLVSPRTRAIIPVHYAGQPADMDEIGRIASAAGVPVIEDAAHALGTSYRGRRIGTSQNVTVFSFHPIKNMTTGEGGMIMTRDAGLADRFRLMRFHGVSKDAWKRYSKGGTPQYEVLRPGFKYNMLDLQAALGICQLRKIDRFNARRTELAQTYDRLFEGLDEVRPIGRVAYPAIHSWHLYVARLYPGALEINRDEFMAALQAENIGAGLHFPALHMQPFYREKYGYRAGSLPAAESAGSSIFSMPLYPLMTDGDAEDALDAVRRVVSRNLRSRT